MTHEAQNWEDFCNKWLIRWILCKLRLAGGVPFMDRDTLGNSYLRCTHPRLGKLLFRQVAVIGHQHVLE